LFGHVIEILYFINFLDYKIKLFLFMDFCVDL